MPADAALFLTVVIWSLNFVSVKIGIASLDPLAFSVIRFGIGTVTTLLVVRLVEGPLRFARADLPLLVVAALFGITLNQLCFVFGLSISTASNLALLVGTIPIWTAVVAVVLRYEVLDARVWLGVAGGMVGVVLIVLGAPAVGGGEIRLLGALLALGTAATWGVYSVLIRPLMRRYSAMQVSAFMMTAGTAALVPLALPALLGEDYGAVPMDAWLWLLYSALASVTLTNILYFNAIHRVGPARAAMFTYLEPFLGVLFAVVLLREQVAAVQIAGGIVVVAAILFARSRPAPVAEPGI